ncbi:MAG: EpsG family protein [Bacillota bacterium]
MDNLIDYSGSIILYVACFLLTAAMAGLAQIYQQKRRPVALSPSMTLSTRPNRIWWILSLMVLLLLSSLRYGVGTDYATYGQLYTSLNQIDSLDKFIAQIPVTEPGYILLNFFVKAVFNQYLVIYALCALVTLGFFYKAFEDYHEKGSVMLAALVFIAAFFSLSLNIMRQMMAVAIMFFATRYIFQRKYGAAAAWTIVAASFHVTALVVVPFWIIRGDRRWERITRIVLFAALVALLFGGMLFSALFTHIPFFRSVGSEARLGATPGLGLLLLRAPIFIPVLIYRKKLMEHDERNRLWIIFMLFEIAFCHLGYINSVFSRISLYFAASWAVLLPSLVRCMPDRSAQYRMGAYVVLVLVGLWVFNSVINNYNEVLPYKSLFDGLSVA